jgi:gluconate 2-dehydrogenase gamma chain
MDTTKEPSGTSRRQFLQAAGGSMGLAWLAASWPTIVAASEHAHAMAAADTANRSKLLFLTPAQARDVDAIATQIVPSGATPGAHEAGVVYFIDQMHAGHWQEHGKEFLTGLADFQARCSNHHPGTAQFADLSFDEQTAYLHHVQKTPFFNGMRFMTVIGLLALPSYGGNADRLGWKLVGFVDQHAWDPPFGHYDAEYRGFVPYPGHTPYMADSTEKSA